MAITHLPLVRDSCATVLDAYIQVLYQGCITRMTAVARRTLYNFHSQTRTYFYNYFAFNERPDDKNNEDIASTSPA